MRKTVVWLLAIVISCGFLVGAVQISGAMTVRSSPEVAAAALAPSPDCALLDDAQARGLMSAAFELRLRVQCGWLEKSGEAMPASAAPVAPQANVQVNDPASDVGMSTTQSETSISVNPVTGTICSAYNDSQHWAQGNIGFAGFSRSTDGGSTFEDRGPIPEDGSGGNTFGDASLVWRAADGNFYYAGLHSNGLGLWRSSDECQSFAFRSMIHTGGGDDQERMAVDNNPDSPYYGRLYVAWTDFAASAHIYVTISDNGTTWSTPVDLSQHDSVTGAWPAVAPNGDVYVGWLHWDVYPTGPIDIEIVRSDDGGATWETIVNPMDNKTNPRHAGASTSCSRPALNGNIRYAPYPQLAVGPDGCLHAVYAYDPGAYNAGDVVNVYYRRSCDDGATWRPEDRLNDDATTADQWSPTLSVGPDNVVVAAWYDRRLDPDDNLMYDYYSARSLDGGVHWESNVRISSESSPVPTLSPNFDPIVATCYHGDSDQQVQDGLAAYLQWSDDRNEQNSHPDPDIWFERVWTERPLDAPSSLHAIVPYNETRTKGLRIDNVSPISVGFEIVEVDRGYTTPTVRSAILSTGATLIDPCLVAITSDSGAVTETTELETTLAELWGTWVVVTSVQQAQDAGADVVIDRIAGTTLPTSDYNDWFDDGHGLVHIGDWPNWFPNDWEGEPAGTPLAITVGDRDHALAFDLPPAWIGRGFWAYGWSNDAVGWVTDSSYPNIGQGRYTSLRGRVVSARDYAPGRAVYLGLNTYGSLASDADKTLLQNAVDWSGSCGRFGGVVWMDELPLAGTMPMSDTQVINLTFDASVPEITGPGQYYATLLIETDAAFDTLRVPITMTVVLISPIHLPAVMK